MVTLPESVAALGVTVGVLVTLGVFLAARRIPRKGVVRQADGAPGSRSAEGTIAVCGCGPDKQCLSAGRSCEPRSVPKGCIETRIVYIHNDPRGFKTLAKELQRYCIDLTGVHDADTAYLACFSEKPKMVLVDSELPGADASGVLKRIQQHPLAADIHTMVVTERTSGGALHQECALDGKRRLIKPIDVEQLLAELTRHTTLCRFAPDCTGQPARYEATSSGSVAEDVPAAGLDADPLLHAERPEQGHPTTADLTEESVPQRRPKVLCIDDDPHISQAIMMRLRPLGVDVIQAFDGMQGFWTGLDTRPDVIITDMRMPDGDGNYIFSRFRSHPLTKDVPVIILTGNTNPAVRRTMLSLGAAAYLTKPWSFDELRKELECYIDLCPAGAEGLVSVAT